MEISENRPAFIVSPIVDKELGPENIKNLTKLSNAIKIEAENRNIEAHLILVGGCVDQKKQGKFHKDIDLVLYSPDLSSETIPKNECPKFDKFASFISDVAKSLDWESKIILPWFRDIENSADGSVVLSTNDKPIEILPVREDFISDSFEDYIKSERRPFAVIF
ncbi:MAG TPA: hypothetical protein PK257_03600 [Candidatus Woesebacteria bacterium]|nr:hypothetical protein [Candidatus Woesebacteria bacterium]